MQTAEATQGQAGWGGADLPPGTRAFEARDQAQADHAAEVLKGAGLDSHHPFRVGDMLFVIPNAEGVYFDCSGEGVTLRGEVIGVHHNL